MKNFTEEDIERIQNMVDSDDAVGVRHEIADLHPADIAELLGELNIKQADWLFNLIDDKEQKADVLMELDEEDRNEDTAGGLMGTEYIAVNENWSMPECLKEMRRQAADVDEIYYVSVIDDDNRLKGILPLKKMITDPSVSKIKHVMQTDPVKVHSDTPIDEVAIDFEKYDLVAMLAGMPPSIVKRANQVLERLEYASNNMENKGVDSVSKGKLGEIAGQRDGYQLSFFQLDDPLLSQIRDRILTLDIDNLTPLQSLTLLHDLKSLLTGK